MNNTFQAVHKKICTVHRNWTISRWYIRNVYCAQKQNTFQTIHRNVYCAEGKKTFQTVHQKCVLCTGTEHFPVSIAEMCTVHRNKLFQAVYKNLYCAQKQNTFQTIHRNVYCVQKKNTSQAGHQKYVMCTGTEHFQNDTARVCNVHRNRTLSRRYIRNVYCA